MADLVPREMVEKIIATCCAVGVLVRKAASGKKGNEVMIELLLWNCEVTNILVTQPWWSYDTRGFGQWGYFTFANPSLCWIPEHFAGGAPIIQA
jgi:hypothetical protein